MIQEWNRSHPCYCSHSWIVPKGKCGLKLTVPAGSTQGNMGSLGTCRCLGSCERHRNCQLQSNKLCVYGTKFHTLALAQDRAEVTCTASKLKSTSNINNGNMSVFEQCIYWNRRLPNFHKFKTKYMYSGTEMIKLYHTQLGTILWVHLAYLDKNDVAVYEVKVGTTHIHPVDETVKTQNLILLTRQLKLWGHKS